MGVNTGLTSRCTRPLQSQAPFGAGELSRCAAARGFVEAKAGVLWSLEDAWFWCNLASSGLWSARLFGSGAAFWASAWRGFSALVQVLVSWPRGVAARLWVLGFGG